MLPLTPLNIAPGFFTLKTDRGANGRWKDGDKVRFHNALPQKIGGWQRSGTTTHTGKVRGVTDWQTLAFEKFIGAGSNLKLQLWKGGAIYDITPIRKTVNPMGNNPFATTNGSSTVTVTDVAHGALDGDYVHFSGAAAFNNVTIDGEYVLTWVDVDHYTITAGTVANATSSGGGAVVVAQYEINVGAEDSTYGLGWGAGPWGSSTWGTPRTLSNFLTMARIWSLDQWGEDLIANPRGAGIYLWDASVGTGTRAAAIAGAPSTARSILVSPEGQHLVALGANSGTADDPLLIRWSSSGDYTSFTASPSNSAGSKRLNTGNEILCGVKGNKEILVFTDSHVWRMAYVGPPYTFDFKSLGQHGGMRGPNAVVEVNGVLYWMGEKNFYYYDGAVDELPCDVWPTIFDNNDPNSPGINFVQRAKTFAGFNREFGEIWWLYCSESSTEVDRYVIYNVFEKLWYFGTIARTVYVGDSDIFSTAFAVGTNGYLYDHESGDDSDGAAMTATLDSGDIEIGDGDFLMQIGMLVPDFKVLTGSISLTVTTKKWPHRAATQSKGPYAITSSTEFLNPRIKGRQVSLGFESNAVGDHWRMGTFRIGLQQHGRK